MMKRPFLVFEITSQCNLNCIFCYNVWHEQSCSIPECSSALSIGEIDQLFKKINEEVSPSGFALTGGEPLLYSDIVEVVEILKTYSDLVNLVSNGLLLTPKKLDCLVQAGLSHLDISLLSLHKTNYKNLTGFDHLEKIMKIFSFIKKFNVIFNVSIMVCRMNYSEVNELIDFATACGADSVTINVFTPTGRGLKNKKKLNLQKSEIFKLLDLAEMKSEKLNIPINLGIPLEPCIYPLKKYQHLKFSSCLCGFIKWVIDPQGNLRICEQSEVVLGSLFRQSFSELSSAEQVKLFRDFNLKQSCFICSEYEVCRGGCRFRRD